MSKLGRRLIANVRETNAQLRGEKTAKYVVHVPDEVDVRAVRRKLGYSQAEFATAFGFSLDALQNWEQGRRKPDPTARVLLTVIEKKPDAVREALLLAERN